SHTLYEFLHIFFSTTTSTTAFYTLSLHDALPISFDASVLKLGDSIIQGREFMIQNAEDIVTFSTLRRADLKSGDRLSSADRAQRSEEHTSELQSLRHLVCRLLLEKKKKTMFLASA